MIPRLTLAALLIGIASATAQNMSQMGMAPYASPPPLFVPTKPADAINTGPVRYSNPMMQVCPDGWGYGPTVSGTNPVCVAPEDGKDNAK